MSDSTLTTVIVSGYFNPFHIGHLRYLQAAAEAGDKLIVIVNNDRQQMLKKGKVIMSEDDRREIVGALRIVDEAVIASDQDPTVVASIEAIAKRERGVQLVFGNGGDRDSAKEVPEKGVCDRYGVRMVYDMGGTAKADSSTRINEVTGAE